MFVLFYTLLSLNLGQLLSKAIFLEEKSQWPIFYLFYSLRIKFFIEIEMLLPQAF